MRNKLCSTILVGVLACLTFCCGVDKTYTLVVRFSDAAVREKTVSVRLFVIIPEPGIDCAVLVNGTASGYQPETSVDVPVDRLDVTLKGVFEGTRYFFGEARDSQKQVIAIGCAEVQTGPGGPTEVVLVLE